MNDSIHICFSINDVLGLVGDIMTLGSIIAAAVVAYCAITGILRALWRFGLGVAWRKVHIIADADVRDELRSDLIGSGIIKKRNIATRTKGMTGNLKGACMFILDYEYLGEDEVLKILSNKDFNSGALVYAKPGIIPEGVLDKLNTYQHVSVVNFRGRLVNEALLLLLSTSFTRKDIKSQVS